MLKKKPFRKGYQKGLLTQENLAPSKTSISLIQGKKATGRDLKKKVSQERGKAPS